MRLQKIFIILSLFLFGLWNAFAQEEWEIFNLDYSGNLSENSVININWKNLIECTNLNINWKEIPFVQASDKKVTYKYSDTDNEYNWELKLTCSWDILNKAITLPYIEKIEFSEKWGRDIFIKWENFYPDISVKLDSGSFDLKNSTLTSLFWTLPIDLDKLWVYVEANGKKSNKIDIPLELISLDYIKTDTSFWVGEEIEICWKNLEKNNYIYIDNRRFDETKELINNCFVIKLPEIEKKQAEIYVQNKYYKTGKIKFNSL